MIEWRDEGILLNLRAHGENGAICEVFTRAHGLHAGMVRGAQGRRLGQLLQPGAQLDVSWRARLDAHIGAFQVEPLRSRAAAAMSGRLSLAGLSSVVALLAFCLPERQAYPALYQRSEQLLDLLGQDAVWPLAYMQWERALLEEMGFGLDLERCAVTGATEGLAYVSPRSGRAVSAEGAGDWAARLLPLPPCLRGEGAAEVGQIALALRTTGFFLAERLAPQMGARPLPAARARLISVLEARGAAAER